MRKPQQIGRRRFLTRVPAAVVAVSPVMSGLSSSVLSGFSRTVEAGLSPTVEAARQGASATLGKDALKSAEQVAGLTFTDAEEEMALPGATRNLESFERLRQLDIPLDTEPAISFRPYLSGKRPRGRARRNAPLTVRRPATARVTSRIDDLALEPVTVLSALIESRTITSTNLTKMYLARLKKYGEPLHCVVTLTEELALAQAANADRDLKLDRYHGPLHGIPWGAKDLFATKGVKTTWGAKPYENQVLNLDATVVERLRDAGAVLVAKLSMGSLAQGGVWFGGITRNPWRPDTGSSGSSAGPAAATAAGLVGFALGTETRGSIITPASICGVVGLRPTYGRVSRYGAMALSWTMDKIGPLCRSVEDCALVFNAIYGADGRDDTVVDAPFAWNPALPISRLRVGYVEKEFAGDLTSQNANPGLLKDALDVFRKSGAKLEAIELPDFPTDAINFILSAEAAAAFDDLTRSKGIDQLTEQGPGAWPNTFRTSRFIPAVEYIRAQRARTLLTRKMDDLMSTCHVFLAPARGSASLPITNLTGHPAVCLKNGFVDGLPQALMITGRLYDEATLLRVALAYERSTKWRTMHPALQGLGVGD
jgi:Asp-tRNA(Asn)/Glu-tRNA(Gln) amidotransferase A subunit family amidase